jgi:TPR repeat protein
MDFHRNDGISIMSDYQDTHDCSLRATAGDAQAQFILAECYAKGEGVQQSSRNAAYWYARAAGQGHVQAQQELARSRKEGEGAADAAAQRRAEVVLASDGARWCLGATQPEGNSSCLAVTGRRPDWDSPIGAGRMR